MAKEHKLISKDEIKDGEIKSFFLQGTPVILIQKGEKYHALGGMCPHKALELEEGKLHEDTIACSFHLAHFNLEDGRPVEPPAVEPIPVYDVTVKDNDIYVNLQSRDTGLYNYKEKNLLPDKTFVVVGGGAAGESAARSLREKGFGGKILLFDREGELPYDRTNVNKAFIDNGVKMDAAILQKEDFYNDLNIELHMGIEVRELDEKAKKITTSKGDVYDYDKILIATGGKPITLGAEFEDLENVFTVRTADDAKMINSAAENAKKAVLVGAGFIGLEMAVMLTKKDMDVTVVAPEEIPYAPKLGDEIGKAFQKRLEKKGINFIMGEEFESLGGEDKADKIVLKSGKEIEGDLFIISVGIRPDLDFVKETSFYNEKGLETDEYLKAAEDIYAAGDIAVFPYYYTGEKLRIEHWRTAEQMGVIAAENMLGTKRKSAFIPFFWSKLGDFKLICIGSPYAWDDIIIDGDPEEKFLAHYIKDNRIISTASVGREKAISNIEYLMRHNKMPGVEKVRDNAFDFDNID